jgi:hypothetical protein
VCFPDAPVSLHTYTSRKSQDERDRRAAEKDARAAVKAAKTLTEAEQFKTTGRFPERITTVAACKELIRKAVEAEVELEWINRPEREARADADMLIRMRSNRYDALGEAISNARQAMTVLIDREQAHEGWGATAADIDAMMARKDKSARKEWGL